MEIIINSSPQKYLPSNPTTPSHDPHPPKICFLISKPKKSKTPNVYFILLFTNIVSLSPTFPPPFLIISTANNIATKIIKYGRITKNQERPFNPFVHKKFKNQVQISIRIIWARIENKPKP